MSNPGPVYDSAEETEREMTRHFGGGGGVDGAGSQPRSRAGAAGGAAAPVPSSFAAAGPPPSSGPARLRVVRRKATPVPQEPTRPDSHRPPTNGYQHAPSYTQAPMHAPHGPSQAGAPRTAPRESRSESHPAQLVPAAPTSTGPAAGAPPPMPAFPATLFWADKLPVLGATYLVAEAMVRTMMMNSEEFADRVAWIALERLVRDLRTVRGRFTAERSEGGRFAAERSEGGRFAAERSEGGQGMTRAAALVEIKRMLGEIRATHAAFHTSIDYTFVHGAILTLLRVTQLASLSAEFALAPYNYTLDRHVQELVFLCDFAGMVLSRISLSDVPHHQPMIEERAGAPALWMPAHYANEALLRAMPILDAMPETAIGAFSTSAVARAASKLLNDHANAVSNTWLARNLLRIGIGYRMIANAWDALNPNTEEAGSATDTSSPAGAVPAAATAGPLAAPHAASPFSAAVRAAMEEILKERATAIHSWTQRNGSETGAVFMDPLYRIEDEIQARRM